MIRFGISLLIGFFANATSMVVGQQIPRDAIEAWEQADKNFPKAGTWTIDVNSGDDAYRWVVSLVNGNGRLLENDKMVFVSKEGDAIDFVLKMANDKRFELRAADKDERQAYSRVLSAIFEVKRPWWFSPNLTLTELFAEKETHIKNVTERAGGLVEIEFERTNQKSTQKWSMVFDKNNHWSMVSSIKRISGDSKLESTLTYDDDGRLSSAHLVFPKGIVTVKIVAFDPKKPDGEIFNLEHYGIDEKVSKPKLRSKGIHPAFYFVAIGICALAFAYIRSRQKG